MSFLCCYCHQSHHPAHPGDHYTLGCHLHHYLGLTPVPPLQPCSGAKVGSGGGPQVVNKGRADEGGRSDGRGTGLREGSGIMMAERTVIVFSTLV